MPISPSDYQREKDGQVLVDASFGFNVFFTPPATDCAEAIQAIYETFLELGPESALKYYANESMSKHKTFSKSALQVLPKWLKGHKSSKRIFGFELNGSKKASDAPTLLFSLITEEYPLEGEDPLEELSLLTVLFPADAATDNLQSIVDLFQSACTELPVRYATCGYCLTTTRYDEERSQTLAWAIGMRHHGFDIYTDGSERFTVGLSGVKTPGWITYIDQAHLETLGGVTKLQKNLPNSINVKKLGSGISFQVGDAPAVGDTNRKKDLSGYKAVYRKMLPLINPTIDDATSFTLDDDDEDEKTERWLRRFE